MEVYHHKFLQLLMELFGEFDPQTKKFEHRSNSVIARELFYSDSQFSRLINQTASEGEYVRAIKVIQRYQEFLALKNASSEQPHLQKAILGRGKERTPLWWLSIVGALLMGAGLTYWLSKPSPVEPPSSEVYPMDYLLNWAFEESHVKSYINLSDLPMDCDYPCYRLQGKWNLSKDYKLPVFGEQSGFHYWATDVNMFARCMSERDSTGKTLEGLEYQRHEIWYDQRELPIDSFLVHKNESLLRPEYQALDFKDEPHFVRVAQVHTFFRNEFSFVGNEIARSGKVIGRYIAYEPLDSLKKANGLVRIDLEAEVLQIVQDRVKDFSRPIRCDRTPLPKSSFNEMEEMDQLMFNCALTTGRFPIQYTKGYQLVDQHIKNACRSEITRN